MNYRLKLMYDGTHYAGWQRQNNAVTIQGELEKALSVITREAVSTVGVSRTDAGVHAACFTANVHLENEIDAYRLFRGTNALLPEDIRVIGAEPCDEDFNARFDAVQKTYLYRIDTTPHGNVFYRNYAWHVPQALNLANMQKAAGCFLGSHDFSGFMAQGGSSKTFTRTIFESSFSEQDGLLTYRITGNGFLYNMVRIISGTLVAVGKGKIDPDDIPDIIVSKDRTRAGMTAPAHGLTLLRAEYADEIQIKDVKQ
ncbi:MAG: tRNA pseudouridine(38-40) synthase TruA [Ruminococcaceae bacterium]|nr:tRNA pseudouridine(38-40) synthase TruA [Oscillospiraceae bacterium]